MTTLLLVLLMGLSPERAPAQVPSDPVGDSLEASAPPVYPAGTVSTAVEPGPVVVVPSNDQVISGLPRRAPEPPTMREFWPWFVGFALAWLSITAYVLTLGRPWRRIAASANPEKTS
jgi:hypothetical protein